MPIFLVILSLKNMVTMVATEDMVTSDSALVIDIANASCINTTIPDIMLFPATYIEIESMAIFNLKSLLIFLSLFKIIPSFIFFTQEYDNKSKEIGKVLFEK